MSNWQNFRSLWQGVRYCLIFLAALWLSLGVPGCSFSPPNSQTSSSPQPTQIKPTVQRFDGITINFLSQADISPVAIKPHISKFESQTGAKVNLINVPHQDIHKTLWKDWSSGASKYDAATLVSPWMTDFAKAGYLENLTQHVQSDTALQWDDVAPFFQNFSATYQGRTYAIPLDGDFHIAYYRKDLLEQAKLEPPSTWEEYLAIAKRFHGKDLNGDGQPDYGSCIDRTFNGTNAAYFFWSIVSPFLQSQGTAQGTFFEPQTMKPLVNNQAFARALDISKQERDYGSPQGTTQRDVAKELFIRGRCALSVYWGDIGTIAINPAISKVIDKVGATITPGTTQVLDRKTGKLVACDKFTCPYNIEGINHAPYAAGGGWVGVVNAKANSKVKDAAYSFISFISQPAQSNVDVTIGDTGFNPYRISQFNNQEAWIKAGMTSDAASKYLGGISVSLNSPNMVLDLRIPQNQRYQTELLGSVLIDFLTDKITREEAIQRIEKGWEQITNEVGRESQRTAYRASLGLTP
ncbi:extracellular solute-binding protein [Nostoc sp. NMS4]|uniref:ABC transporter substrate-binding protein n=1 Tax=Nostoc sp. NMS4 TaxID=2815390 RepID=UPI0025EB6204|nr:extracellular solute-binding protein [Nostoc sp. NMS4]MBN3926854.1 extracellular solute-binding protein [Nostoc sp. NMS4]